jgi:GNAT superfamily N-acetyltransferase
MENDMDTDRFQVITPFTHTGYRDLVRGLTRIAWPEFMLHDQVANELWHELLDRFPEYQLALYDTEDKRVAAMGNSFPLRWVDSLETLPEGGWDWAFVQAVKDHKQGVSPNFHCAIQVIIHPDYRGHRLSRPMIEAVRAVSKAKKLQALIIPVRPSEKSKYPLIPIDDYTTWKTEEGLPFDAWLRVHARLQGKIIKTCHESKIIRGTRAEWEAWTGLKFPQSGEYIIPEALVPIQMNIEKDEGVYTEPNVWIVHEVG